MPRRISDAQFRQAITDKKIDRKATGEARRQEGHAPSEEIFDHPLIAQGKAMQNVAERLGSQGQIMQGLIRDLASALSKDSGVGETLKVLTALIEQNNALAREMMESMADMHKQRQDDIKIGAYHKRKPWKLKITRNSSGVAETIDVVPVEDSK